MSSVFKYFISIEFLESLVIVVLCFFMLKTIKVFLIKNEVTKPKSKQKKSTTIGVFFSSLQYIVVLAAIFIILSINGIDPSGIFTGLGIVATIVGLALQDTLKDILSGINIYNNNFYKVGDVVDYDGHLCEVKFFNARVTKFRDLFTDGTYTVCNSIINKAHKVKNKHLCKMLIDYNTKEDILQKAFKHVGDELLKIEGLETIIGSGIVNFTQKGLEYAISYQMDPKLQFEKYFEIMSTIHRALLEEKVPVIEFIKVKDI